MMHLVSQQCSPNRFDQEWKDYPHVTRVTVRDCLYHAPCSSYSQVNGPPSIQVHPGLGS